MDREKIKDLLKESLKKNREDLSYFLKSPLYYTGGKKEFYRQNKELFPKNPRRYIEPFLGGGGIFFGMNPERAIISDTNKELINFFTILRDRPEDLIEWMLDYKNTKNDYYRIRDLDRNEYYYEMLDPAVKAARFYYLNRMSFNGLYRVNSKGQFNAPYGYRKWEFEPEVACLVAVSKKLQEKGIEIYNRDFRDILKETKAGDFVYLDPPILDSLNYTNKPFTKEDLKDLKDLCDKMTEKDVRFLLTYSYNDSVLEYFMKDYKIASFTNLRKINSDVTNRKNVKDIILKN